MLLAELEARGAASASEEDLLRSLGWTRTRAVQVFSDLERAGLVTSETEKGSSGRPRKVYRPVEGASAV
jgi:predicted transcriptional regulator